MKNKSSIKHIVDVRDVNTATLITFGLPMPKGFCLTIDNICLHQWEQALDADFKCLAFWPDKSLRWVSCDVIVKHSGPITLQLNCTQHNKQKPSQNKNTRSETVDKDIPTALNKGVFFQHPECMLNAAASLTLVGQDKALEFTLRSNKQSATALSQSYEVEGYFTLADKLLNLFCWIEVCNETNEYSIKVRIHNPRAAVHVGGKWDLGDPNSLNIANFSINFHSPDTHASVFINKENAHHSTVSEEPNYMNEFRGKNGFSLTQFGSGGKHWQSPIHWDANKQSTVTKQGFEITQEGSIVYEGLRAKPIVSFTQKIATAPAKRTSLLMLEGFWQNFPVSVTCINQGCAWKLLPFHTELQGGESKTWTFIGHVDCFEPHGDGPTLNINSLLKHSTLVTKPTVIYVQSYLNQCNVFPHLFFCDAPSAVGELIMQGLSGDANFFIKRENKDVFGWRNYGELDADHEAIYAAVKSDFISHYNNQYDPLMGMTLQFLHTGNCQWLELIRPLNQHIQDIDIYDTSEDKAEYNGGLMWHTDHYLSAHTSTHRSNSKYHEHAYEGFLGGGGPGGQHCYTSGLALQYWIFGDQQAKHKVTKLCSWIRNFYNGGGSIVERTFRLLTIDFKQDQLTNIGFKAPGYKYPLDRGTGNFLNALIDHYEITCDASLLPEMGDVIRQTLHPNDNISLRELNNVEQSWFYTIFLQALVRYLLLKENFEHIDADYWYARHSLLHYGKWMSSEEQFYLDKPQQLEFPNDTWCAQELRKANLFNFLYYFSSDQNIKYIQKAEIFYTYIHSHLAASSETQYTRILAILMQNDGVEQMFRTHTKPKSHIVYQTIQYGKPPSFNRTLILKIYLFDIRQLFSRFSWKQEFVWLYTRLKHLFNK
jgi:hypothetical protein